ncbi:MAG: hypothetical protein KF724_08370 [Phycisphaeraceae bacterium]|nr:hypothetical protein [Phycisphaeraceae bacterium]
MSRVGEVRRPDQRTPLGLLGALAVTTLGAATAVAGADQVLRAPGAQPRDFFGSHLALGHSVLAVPVTRREPGLKGLVVLFRRSPDGVWTQVQSTIQESVVHGSEFGAGIAVDGDIVVIGSPGFVIPQQAPFGNMRGRVQVFRLNADDTHVSLFTQSVTPNFDRYGSSVAMSHGWIVAGRPGSKSAAVQFLRIDDGVVSAMQAFPAAAGSATSLGDVVAINSGWAAAGAVDLSAQLGLHAAVRIFKRTGESLWAPFTTLQAPYPQLSNWHGLSLAMDEERIIVGSPATEMQAQPRRGVAFIYRRVGDLWSLEAELEAPNEIFCEGFGRAVAIDGLRVAISAVEFGEARGGETAAVFIFEFIGGAWHHVDTRLGAADTDFGAALALKGGTLVIGAPGTSDDKESFEGCVIVTTLIAGDLNGDGVVNGADLAILLGSWGAAPPGTIADLNGDGVVDGADLALLLGQWS